MTTREAKKINLTKGHTCQDCKYQSNNPSWCGKQSYFVRRKGEICQLFNLKWRTK